MRVWICSRRRIYSVRPYGCSYGCCGDCRRALSVCRRRGRCRSCGVHFVLFLLYLCLPQGTYVHTKDQTLCFLLRDAERGCWVLSRHPRRSADGTGGEGGVGRKGIRGVELTRCLCRSRSLGLVCVIPLIRMLTVMPASYRMFCMQHIPSTKLERTTPTHARRSRDYSPFQVWVGLEDCPLLYADVLVYVALVSRECESPWRSKTSAQRLNAWA